MMYYDDAQILVSRLTHRRYALCRVYDTRDV